MTDSWTAFGLELPLVLARNRRGSVRAELEDALRSAVRDGRLAPGARMPSTRTLAADLGLSRGTVVEAYRQLTVEGYLIARSGSSTRVAASAASPRGPVETRAPADPQLRWDFRPALPDLALFPRSAWGRSLRQTLQRIPDRALGYGDPRGSAGLRSELAGYLRRVRNVQADPEQIVICSGFTQALALICRVLGNRVPFAVEDPGSPAAWSRIRDAGIDCLPLAVDERGLSVQALTASAARFVLVTPAHQFPTGVTLAPERRTALLSWAAAGGLVLEDDYDAEFRYDGQPVGALQGLAPERVLYAGSVSKTLAPALRLAWLVLPAALVDDVAEAKRIHDLGCPAIDQHAFAHMLASGAYDRHLRRARRKYRATRDALTAALDLHAPHLRVQGIAAGLHVLITLPAGLDEHVVADSARQHGLGVYPLSDYCRDARHSQRALVLGYGSLSEPAVGAGVAQLANVISQLERG
jgi:GntR family transcriptional regulator/MocR family aminotransferase